MKWILQGMIAALAIANISSAADDPKSVVDSKSVIRVIGCRIRPADQVTLAVNQSGILGTVAQEGDEVDEDQCVVRLEDELPRTTLAIAEKEAANETDIRYSEKASEVARLEYDQALKVNESVKGSLTVIELRRRKLELDRSVLQIEQSQYKQAIAVLKRDEASALLKAFHVTAPFSGTVTKVLKHKGEAVRAGEPVLELVSTRRVRVEGFVDVANRRCVRSGMEVVVEPEGMGNEAGQVRLKGKISFVDTLAQAVTRQVRVWADVENPDEVLLPGLTATIHISCSSSSVAKTDR